ncbi:hypothetical protein LAZ67_20000502 [Cordylochernes scorpioides]|uniref:Reverse transcriptase domain-containing protein n=1 Tax=Cordylochernes scorpioides TaxID=51811 RepID=A0ABY6LP30_9ARAC|nr:hypothetical protein LAZ67_20000502 [Cordylochernes scorpioides]
MDRAQDGGEEKHTSGGRRETYRICLIRINPSYCTRGICLLYKPSQDLEADIFTKDLSRDQMKKHLENLSIVGIKTKPRLAIFGIPVEKSESDLVSDLMENPVIAPQLINNSGGLKLVKLIRKEGSPSTAIIEVNKGIEEALLARGRVTVDFLSLRLAQAKRVFPCGICGCLSHRTHTDGKKCTNAPKCANCADLGPFLWNIVFDELLTLDYRNNVFPQAYADDLVVVVSGCRPSQLPAAQHTIDMIARWCSLHKLELSVGKCQAMVLLRPHGRLPEPRRDLVIHGRPIQWCDSIKAEALGLVKALENATTLPNHLTLGFFLDNLSVVKSVLNSKTDPPFFENEVKLTAFKFGKRKSPGPEGIDNTVVKALEELPEGARLVLYADDQFLIVEAASRAKAEKCVETSLQILSNWAHDSGLKFNVSKTKALSFKPRDIRTKRKGIKWEHKPAIGIEGRRVALVNRMTILGVVIDDKMGWQYQAEEMVARGREALCRPVLGLVSPKQGLEGGDYSRGSAEDSGTQNHRKISHYQQ